VVKTKINMCGIELKNPVMTASGTFGYGQEYAPFVNIEELGAVIVKGLSVEPRRGNPPPRIIETPSGMLNAVGLENIGVKSFVKNKLPYLKQYDVAVIANIFGETVEEYVKVADIINDSEGVSALEINISCPNVERGGIAFGGDPDLAYDVTSCVKRVTDLPVIVKLSPNVGDITLIARSVEDAGADAISLINTVKGMSVDIEKRIPHLKNVTGGLSGPAIKPVALRMVWEAVNAVSLPVIGLGGIMSASDALEFLIAGARAIEVGTATFVNPRATLDIIEGIKHFMHKNNIVDINDLIGTLVVEGGDG